MIQLGRLSEQRDTGHLRRQVGGGANNRLAK